MIFFFAVHKQKNDLIIARHPTFLFQPLKSQINQRHPFGTFKMAQLYSIHILQHTYSDWKLNHFMTSTTWYRNFLSSFIGVMIRKSVGHSAKRFRNLAIWQKTIRQKGHSVTLPYHIHIISYHMIHMHINRLLICINL